jgi:hypothetical protein
MWKMISVARSNSCTKKWGNPICPIWRGHNYPIKFMKALQNCVTFTTFVIRFSDCQKWNFNYFGTLCFKQETQ